MKTSERITVLNVDDIQDSLRVKSYTLRRAGYNVIESATGTEALRLVAEESPDLVLLDVNLPDISGFDVCRRIKSDPLTSSTLVVQISACFVKSSDRARGLEGGADGYLTSPVDPPLLVATVKSLLRMRQTLEVSTPQQYWQPAYEAINDGALLLDARGEILKTNVAARRMLNVENRRLDGRALRTVLPVDSKPIPGVTLLGKVASCSQVTVECLWRGQTLQLTSNPRFNSHGEVAGTLCFLSPVTSSLVPEAVLRQFQQFANRVEGILLLVSPEGCILHANEKASTAYGYSLPELFSLRIQDLICPDLTKSERETDLQQRECGGTWLRTLHRRKDGSTFPVGVCSRCTLFQEENAILTLVQDATGNSQELMDAACPLRSPDLAPWHDLLCMHRPNRESLATEATGKSPFHSNDSFAISKTARVKLEVGGMASYSEAMHQILKLLPQIAASNSTVLIQGETGTGKEVLARTLHDLSPRSDQPFLPVNCCALPDLLLESELFGYKAGAFTGAAKDKPGRFALAGQGTLFLDEIGDMSPAVQAKLLRVLQERTYDPLGSTTQEETAARIIVATNKNLAQLVREDRFRADLFYRVNVICLELPPLRERMEDVPLLVRHFIEKFNRETGKEVSTIDRKALSSLMSHDFPGNIRELENLLEYTFILCPGEIIKPEHLPEQFIGIPSGKSSEAPWRGNLRSLEAQAIVEGLKRNGFNQLATARELGIHRTTLFRKMKEFGLKLSEMDGSARTAGD